MKFTLIVEMDNAAFADYPAVELLAIFSRVYLRIGDAERLTHNCGEAVRDSNGNTVGRWEIIS